MESFLWLIRWRPGACLQWSKRSSSMEPSPDHRPNFPRYLCRSLRKHHLNRESYQLVITSLQHSQSMQSSDSDTMSSSSGLENTTAWTEKMGHKLFITHKKLNIKKIILWALSCRTTLELQNRVSQFQRSTMGRNFTVPPSYSTRPVSGKMVS